MYALQQTFAHEQMRACTHAHTHTHNMYIHSTHAHTYACTRFTQMSYAELLWVDRLGMYVRVEAAEHLDGLVVSACPACLVLSRTTAKCACVEGLRQPDLSAMQ